MMLITRVWESYIIKRILLLKNKCTKQQSNKALLLFTSSFVSRFEELKISISSCKHLPPALSFFGNTNWLTIIVLISIFILLNSCTKCSVSYNERNSDIQTQTKVVCSYLKLKKIYFKKCTLSRKSRRILLFNRIYFLKFSKIIPLCKYFSKK